MIGLLYPGTDQVPHLHISPAFNALPLHCYTLVPSARHSTHFDGISGATAPPGRIATIPVSALASNELASH